MANPYRTVKNNAKPNIHVEDLTPVKTEAPAPEPVATTANPLAGMALEKPAGKSYAVYLDVDLVEEIDRLAKVNKTNRSKIINLLLRDQIKKLND